MNIKHIIFLLSIVALIACSENDGIEDKQQLTPSIIDDADNLVPVQFSVSGRFDIDFTRALTSIVTFNAGETVKVFVKPNGAANYTGYDYITASSGQNNIPLTAPANPPYYPAGSGTQVEAYAYYPSTANSTFTVASDQTSDANYKASDLMYAVNRTVTKGYSDGNDHLLMEHQMAQLAITATAQAGSGLTIARVEVDALTSVSFAPNTPSIVTATGTTGTITALNAAGTGYIVIPPQVINGVVIRVITGAGTSNEIATYAFTSTTGNFESGASYNINLTVSPDQLGLTSSINQWNGLGSVNVTPSGNLTISAITAQEFTGDSITPSFIVYRDGAIFTSDKYDVKWVNNRDAGTAYILVTGKDLSGSGGANYSTCVGLANFIITPANGKIKYTTTSVSKVYGSTPFTIPLSNYDTRPEHAGQEADGPVTYVSTNPAVATVNENTGEVTLVKAGTTRIKATATNGANYVYSTSDGDHTTFYDLTVNKAAATISFPYSGSANPSQTWSATAANNKYTQTVTNSGDGAVSYSIGSTNTCGATIDSSTGEVTFTKSGSVEVTATVPESTDCYAYESWTTSYTLTVNKANGFIELPITSGSVDAGQSISFYVGTNHGGTLSVSAVSGDSRANPSINGTTVTVATNGVTDGSATIRVTCGTTDCYSEAYADYTLTINSIIDIKKNPLWYMAEYNMTKTPAFAQTGFAGYYFNWHEAMEKFGAISTSYDDYRNAGKEFGGVNYHLPVRKEWWSIIPYDVDENYVAGGMMSIDNGNGTYKNAYILPIWGYNSITKAGITESSYWKKVSNSEMHAIRFLGTEYCSAWKYEFFGGSTTSNPNYLRISATLIEEVGNSKKAAEDWYNNSNAFSSVTFGNVDAVGAVQRELYELGYYSTGSSSTANSGYAVRGLYWSATEKYTSYGQGAYGFGFNIGGTGTGGTDEMYIAGYRYVTYGFSVRLFKDN